MELIFRGNSISSGRRWLRLSGAALICALAIGQAATAEATKCTEKGTSGVDVLKGTGKRDVLCGKGGSDVLIAKGGDDVLKGGGGNDSLTAKAGNDSLAGGPGNDTLAGGKGNDKLKGQAGVDVGSFADAPAPIAIDLAAGTATGNGTDTLIGVENAIGSSQGDTLTGDALGNELSGGDGNDIFIGGDGDDRLKGQGGADTVTYAGLGGPVNVDLRAGSANADGTDSLSGIENVIGTAAGDDLAGDSSANTLDGAGGRDTVSFASSPTPVDADLGAATAAGDGADTLSSIEVLVGSAQADALAGDGADNRISGGDGNDTLEGGGGNDQLDGQGGSDTASYAGAAAPINVNMRTSTATGEGNDAFVSIENATGSPQPDTLAGDAGPNVLDGGGGTDVVSFADSPATIDASLATGVANGDGGDTLLGIENVVGSTHVDTIAGGPGPNVIAARAGDDTVAGADGDDQLIGDDGNDQLFGDANDDGLIGGEGDDHLDGGSGSNDCNGGPGVDTYAGNCDGAAPALTDFSLLPGSVDTSTGPQTITFTLTATDDTGLDPTTSKVIVHGPNPSGQPSFESDGDLVLVSGGPTDGTYTATVTLPQFAAEGTWTVEVQLGDQISNQALTTSSELIAASFPGTFVQSGAGDTLAPGLGTFTESPATIDTSLADRTVTFDLDATDDLSGIDAANSIVTVNSPGGLTTLQGTLTRITGDNLNGTFRTTIVIPRYSAPGTWTVELVLTDGAGNVTSRTSAELGSSGTFLQQGSGDTLAPLLTGFAFNPPLINTSETGQTIEFTIQATDDLAGIDPAGSFVVANDPVQRPREEGFFSLASGTPLNGTYTASVTIPQGSAAGIWQLGLRLIDAVGNVRRISSSELIAAGLPGTFQNVAPTGT